MGRLKDTPEMDLAELRILAKLQAERCVHAFDRGDAEAAATFATGLKRTKRQIGVVERLLDR